MEMAMGIFIGVLAGVLLMAALVKILMPRLMIVTRPSRLGYDETIEKLSGNIEEAEGWVLQSVWDMNESMAKHGVEFPHRVKKLNLCNAGYASEVLTTDRWASSLMPCGIAVWEDDAGKVWVSKMNTGLMGKIFGGTIARVMGGMVARDESKITAGVTG
jgi:uncharacterized protein (DUF302 family)